MNYITQIKAFHDVVEINNLSTGQIALWYGLMYINNKCNWTEWFTVSNQVLSIHTGLSRSGVLKARNVLKQVGVIDFKMKGTNATAYKIVTIANSTQDSTQVGTQVGTQDSMQVGNTLNKRNINETKQKKDTNVSKEKQKHRRGEYGHVLLSNPEIEKLSKDFGEDLTNEAITFLDEYVEMKGYKHKSSNLAIRKWVMDAVKEQRKKKGGKTSEPRKQDAGDIKSNGLDIVAEALRLGVSTEWEGWD